MSKDEKFIYDIENIKKDLAIENMIVTDEDILLLRKYSNNEITLVDVINQIKSQEKVEV